MKRKKMPTKAKAAEILHDGTAQGHPLTDKQRKFFGWLAHKQYGGIPYAPGKGYASHGPNMVPEPFYQLGGVMLTDQSQLPEGYLQYDSFLNPQETTFMGSESVAGAPHNPAMGGQGGQRGPFRMAPRRLGSGKCGILGCPTFQYGGLRGYNSVGPAIPGGDYGSSHLSKMGYRDDSPYRNRESIDIHTPTGQIDMSRTGIPLMANGRYLPPYSGMHQFPPNAVVREQPVRRGGGQYNNSQSVGPERMFPSSQFGGMLTYAGSGELQRPDRFSQFDNREETMKEKVPDAKSGIHIKKSHKGLLHKNLGVKKGEKIPASKLKVKSTDSPAVKKRKVFAQNAKKWHHENGGEVGKSQTAGGTITLENGGYNWQTPMYGYGENGTMMGPYQDGGQAQGGDQIQQQVAQMLQQGAQPQQVLQQLVKQGLPQDQAQQLIQQVLQQIQGQQMAYGGMLPELQYGGSPYPQQRGTNQLPSPFYTGDYNLDNTLYASNYAHQLRQQNTQDQGQIDQLNSSGVPTQQDQQQIDNLQLQMKQNKQQATGADLIGIGSGLKSAFSGIENVVGGFSTMIANNRARKTELEQQNFGNRYNKAQVAPVFGENTNPAFSRYGRLVKYEHGGPGYVLPLHEPSFAYGGVYQMGGAPTEGSDFQSDSPNVMTERGETITDPTKGPMGPDGRPTGVVVHDKTGDAHSDPSGGNAYNLGPQSVVHSKVLGIKVGDFIKAAAKYPNAAHIIDKIAEKYPDPDKEVSYAKLAGLFDTKKLVQEVETIGNKMEKIDKKDVGKENTKITQKTAALNEKTLAGKLQMARQQIAQNTQVAGAGGPIHNIAEHLKSSGAYGDKVKNEQQEQMQSGAPAAETGIRMRGRKLKLPTYQTGGDVKPAPVDKSVDDSYYVDQPGYIQDALFPGQTPPMSPIRQQALRTSTNQLPPIPASLTPAPRTYVDTPDNYSELRTPYSQSNPLNRTNLGDVFKQYSQKDKENKGYYDQISAQLEKGERTLNPIVSNWNAYGQKKNADGTFGAISDDDLVTLENSPGFGFMKEIAKNYGKLHFDPNDQHMIDDYEKATNAADKAQGAIPHFTENNTQPFGKKKFGIWHASYNPWVNQSFGAGQPSSEDPNMPIIYKNTPIAAEPVPAAQEAVKDNTVLGIMRNQGPKPLFREGLNPWQTAGPIATLLTRREPAPYIEDKGAADALAATTRQRLTDIQPALNRIQRGLRAQTQYAPTSRPGVNAQAYANAYDAATQQYGEKYNKDAAIEQEYANAQNRLREAAGTNKAKALDTLAERTAKVISATQDRNINAISNLGEKYTRNVAENRASVIYQQMFPNATWNPYTGLGDFAGGSDILHRGTAANPAVGAGDLQQEKLEAMIEYYEKRGDQAHSTALKNYRELMFNALPGLSKGYSPIAGEARKEMGGKVPLKRFKKKGK